MTWFLFFVLFVLVAAVVSSIYTHRQHQMITSLPPEEALRRVEENLGWGWERTRGPGHLNVSPGRIRGGPMRKLVFSLVAEPHPDGAHMHLWASTNAMVHAPVEALAYRNLQTRVARAVPLPQIEVPGSEGAVPRVVTVSATETGASAHGAMPDHQRPLPPTDPSRPEVVRLPQAESNERALDLNAVIQATRESTFTMAEATPWQRNAIQSVIGVIQPVLNLDDSESLKPHIPEIVATCRSLVADDPRVIRFVQDIYSTAVRASLADWSSNGREMSEQGWSQLSNRLQLAFPGVELTRDDS